MLKTSLHYILILMMALLVATACITDNGRGGKKAVVDFTKLANDEEVVEETPEEEPEVTRPDRQVFVQRDYCACQNGKAVILNDCDSYCASAASTSQPTLYVRIELGAEIELNEEITILLG